MFEKQNKQDKWKKFERIRKKIQERDGFTFAKNIAPYSSRKRFRTGFVIEAFDGSEKPSILVIQTAELVFDLFVTMVHKMFGSGFESRKFNLKAILQTHNRTDSLTPESHCITKYSVNENHLGGIDLEVFLSHLHEFEQLITHDSNLGIKIYSAKTGASICLDTHKQIVLRSKNFYTLERAEYFLIDEGIKEVQIEQISIICNTLHVHNTGQEFENDYQNFLRRLGDEEYKQQ